MKEKVYNFGVFNNWRGYIDLYFNRKELAESVGHCKGCPGTEIVPK